MYYDWMRWSAIAQGRWPKIFETELSLCDAGTWPFIGGPIGPRESAWANFLNFYIPLFIRPIDAKKAFSLAEGCPFRKTGVQS